MNSTISNTETKIEGEEYESVSFDLSLGHERANGGNRRKRAKMGKFIIWDEGLNMLDLVVAANVSVWWNVWEKSSVMDQLAHTGAALLRAVDHVGGSFRKYG